MKRSMHILGSVLALAAGEYTSFDMPRRMLNPVGCGVEIKSRRFDSGKRRRRRNRGKR